MKLRRIPGSFPAIGVIVDDDECRRLRVAVDDAFYRSTILQVNGPDRSAIYIDESGIQADKLGRIWRAKEPKS